MDRFDEEHRLHALVDGELDLRSRLELEASLELDEQLRGQRQDLEQLRAVVREQADYHPAPDALRRRLEALVATANTAHAADRTPRSDRPRPGRPATRAWPAVSRTWAAPLAVAAQFAWQRYTEVDRLADEVVASHVRATLGDRLLDVASSFAGHIPPRCPTLLA